MEHFESLSLFREFSLDKLPVCDKVFTSDKHIGLLFMDLNSMSTHIQVYDAKTLQKTHEITEKEFPYLYWLMFDSDQSDPMYRVHFVENCILLNVFTLAPLRSDRLPSNFKHKILFADDATELDHLFCIPIYDLYGCTWKIIQYNPSYMFKVFPGVYASVNTPDSKYYQKSVKIGRLDMISFKIVTLLDQDAAVDVNLSEFGLDYMHATENETFIIGRLGCTSWGHPGTSLILFKVDRFHKVTQEIIAYPNSGLPLKNPSISSHLNDLLVTYEKDGQTVFEIRNTETLHVKKIFNMPLQEEIDFDSKLIIGENAWYYIRVDQYVGKMSPKTRPWNCISILDSNFKIIWSIKFLPRRMNPSGQLNFDYRFKIFQFPIHPTFFILPNLYLKDLEESCTHVIRINWNLGRLSNISSMNPCKDLGFTWK